MAFRLHFQTRQKYNFEKNALANLEIVNKFCLGILKRVQRYYGISLKRIMGKLGANPEFNFPELIALLILADGEEKMDS